MEAAEKEHRLFVRYHYSQFVDTEILAFLELPCARRFFLELDLPMSKVQIIHVKTEKNKLSYSIP